MAIREKEATVLTMAKLNINVYFVYTCFCMSSLHVQCRKCLKFSVKQIFKSTIFSVNNFFSILMFCLSTICGQFCFPWSKSILCYNFGWSNKNVSQNNLYEKFYFVTHDHHVDHDHHVHLGHPVHIVHHVRHDHVGDKHHVCKGTNKT